MGTGELFRAVRHSWRLAFLFARLLRRSGSALPQASAEDLERHCSQSLLRQFRAESGRFTEARRSFFARKCIILLRLEPRDPSASRSSRPLEPRAFLWGLYWGCIVPGTDEVEKGDVSGTPRQRKRPSRGLTEISGCELADCRLDSWAIRSAVAPSTLVRRACGAEPGQDAKMIVG